MIDQNQTNPIPTSADDTELYNYTPETAPKDVVINIGQAPLLISAQHTLNDPHRMEVGDRRRGQYYVEECVGKMPGLMQLCRVDMVRLEQVNKIRDIRIGKREPDWVIQAREKSKKDGGEQPLPFNPHSDESPLQRAARGI